MIDTKVDGPKDRFTGFPSAAFEFYDGLEADNSSAYWQANKSTFESAVRGPMAALLAGLPEQYHPFHVFRPSRDVRFSADKSPYKTAHGAVSETSAGSVMASTATQHGGQETTIITTQIVLQHHGMIIVPLSYAYAGQTGVDKIRGGSPYGATALTDGDGSRWPSEQDLEGAAFQGKRVAEIATKLHG